MTDPTQITDGFHTMAELYEYRMLYNAAAFNEWARHGTHPVVKSRYHSDGTIPFGGGWFIVVAQLPTGQISNHYELEHWDLFCIPTVDRPPTYDGHTPQQAADRLRTFLESEARTPKRGRGSVATKGSSRRIADEYQKFADEWQALLDRSRRLQTCMAEERKTRESGENNAYKH